METTAKKALKICTESLISDLEPTPKFLAELHAQKILTRDNLEKLNSKPSAESIVAELLQILPKRGPNAFPIFTKEVNKEHSWLATKLRKEHKMLKQLEVSHDTCSEQDRIKKKLIGILETQLLPLIDPNTECNAVPDENSNLISLIQTLEQYINTLERQCLKTMNIPARNPRMPISRLIEEKLKADMKEVTHEQSNDLKKENKELRHKLKSIGEQHKKLTQENKEQKDKLKGYDKTSKELKKYRNEKELLQKDVNMLKQENEQLKQQQYT